jgi:hypothetical protein
MVLGSMNPVEKAPKKGSLRFSLFGKTTSGYCPLKRQCPFRSICRVFLEQSFPYQDPLGKTRPNPET